LLMGAGTRRRTTDEPLPLITYEFLLVCEKMPFD
jgi:hypothetical protein